MTDRDIVFEIFQVENKPEILPNFDVIILGLWESLGVWNKPITARWVYDVNDE